MTPGTAGAAGRGGDQQAATRSDQPAGNGRGRGSSKSRGSSKNSNRAAQKSTSRSPAGRADPARRTAVDVLRGVDERDAYANLLLPALLRERGLTGRDAALATELSYGTLRGQGSYDAILAVCSDRDLAAVDPPLRQVLRLGAHQLLATRVRPHAAVATSVDLARYVAGPRPAGFVNAVLRRVATRDLPGWLDIVAPGRAEDLVGHLSVRYSHPRWIVMALSAALGEAEAGGLAETEAALAADGRRPAVTLCAVPGLASRAELVAAGSQPARWSEFGAYLPDGDPGDVPAVAQGRAGVQDEASQLAALALARAETSGTDRGRWLDMCAGPGGKARLLAGLAAARGAGLLAADVREHRARLVMTALGGAARAGLAAAPGTAGADAGTAGADARTAGPAAGRPGAAAVIAADGTAPAWRPGSFDRVLADVPCSGLGALRRRPEARWRRSPQDIPGLSGLQRELLATAIESARPGGVVAYVTCSPHLAETRDVVGGVLASRGDVEVLDAPGVLAGVPGLCCPAPDGRFAQFWPHRHGTDAIFLALLRRGAHAWPQGGEQR
ncbi:MAG: transcription antitermination factor NusB [Streptosporangiaceae bacterium]|jgi:16S rRNA (cytosine967-C5)-methyltransferase